MGKNTSRDTVSVVVTVDGGGANRSDLPVLEERTAEDGTREALVPVGGDSGGQNTAWVKVDD
jgi:hypothetical protein